MPCISPTYKQARLSGCLLLVAALSCIGCPDKVTVSAPKAPCKKSEIKINNISFTAHTSDIYTNLAFEFCMTCPGDPEAPIVNVPVTITALNGNISETAKSGADGCVRVTARKAWTDVGKDTDLAGKEVSIIVEASDGKKEGPAGVFKLP